MHVRARGAAVVAAAMIGGCFYSWEVEDPPPESSSGGQAGATQTSGQGGAAGASSASIGGAMPPCDATQFSCVGVACCTAGAEYCLVADGGAHCELPLPGCQPDGFCQQSGTCFEASCGACCGTFARGVTVYCDGSTSC